MIRAAEQPPDVVQTATPRAMGQVLQTAVLRSVMEPPLPAASAMALRAAAVPAQSRVLAGHWTPAKRQPRRAQSLGRAQPLAGVPERRSR